MQTSEPIGKITPTPPTARDRRRHVRHAIESPCKVVELKTGRALPGCTHDVSLQGLLVSLRTPAPFHPGDRIKIGVAWRGEAVLHADTLADAEIIRASPLTDGSQTLAIRRLITPALAQAPAAQAA